MTQPIPPEVLVFQHRVQCAAMTRGCRSFLAWKDDYLPGLDPDEVGRRLLTSNGWHMDHGRWVCGHHDRRGGDQRV